MEGYSLELLSHGRPSWDVPHTLSVVQWASQLAKVQGLDILVITTAAYLHDIGYYGQFVGLSTADLDKVMDKKEKHMAIGAEMAAIFLNRPEVSQYLTDGQIERIIYLVSVHDRVDRLKDLDELVLMEADSLGAIDIDMVEPTYQGREAINYLETRMIKRRQRFVTLAAMQAYDGLAKRFRAFIEARDLLSNDLDRWSNEGGASQ